MKIEKDHQIAITELNDELEKSINSISNFNSSIIGRLFLSNSLDIQFLIEKMVEKHSTEIVVCYGNNNTVAKVLTKALTSDYQKGKQGVEFVEIHLNTFIHSTEDFIFGVIAKSLGLSDSRSGLGGFVNLQKVIEDYFEKQSYLINNPTTKNRKDKKGESHGINPNKFLVIYFQNLEYIFAKKRQVAFYTLLELLNKSCNVLFIGMTTVFNLVDMMEKRVRSRFIHSAIYLEIKDTEDIYTTLSKNILDLAETDDVIDKKSLKYSIAQFRKILFHNTNLMIMLRRAFNSGLSASEILIKIKLLLSNIHFELEELEEVAKAESKIVLSSEVQSIADQVINSMYEEEKLGGDYLLLKGKSYFINQTSPRFTLLG